MQFIRPDRVQPTELRLQPSPNLTYSFDQLRILKPLYHEPIPLANRLLIQQPSRVHTRTSSRAVTAGPHLMRCIHLLGLWRLCQARGEREAEGAAPVRKGAEEAAQPSLQSLVESVKRKSAAADRGVGKRRKL